MERMKSEILQGTMFLYYNPLVMDKPMVWVKVEEDGNDEPSLFISNDALVRHCIHGDTPSPTERWLMGDKFYNDRVAIGQFVPIKDLREAEAVCKEKGWPKYEISFGF